MQGTAIVTHVAPTNPAEPFDLLWQMLEITPKIYELCDNSNGTIGAVIGMTLDDLSAISGHHGAAARQPGLEVRTPCGDLKPGRN